jgi:hypothetical protein
VISRQAQSWETLELRIAGRIDVYSGLVLELAGKLFGFEVVREMPSAKRPSEFLF